MRALGTIAIAIVAWAIGVVTGVVLMAADEIPPVPMADPPRWERSL